MLKILFSNFILKMQSEKNNNNEIAFNHYQQITINKVKHFERRNIANPDS